MAQRRPGMRSPVRAATGDRDMGIRDMLSGPCEPRASVAGRTLAGLTLTLTREGG